MTVLLNSNVPENTFCEDVILSDEKYKSIKIY